MNEYIDNDEKEIIESLNSGDWISDFNKVIKKQYEDYAKNTIANTHQISTYITEKDYKQIIQKANQIGIPYKNLIALLVRNYNAGKININL
jgi:predicted DNA binding CopG/RHH family protein